jgi:hypothetical protein
MVLTPTMLFGGPRTVRILSESRKWMKDAYLLGRVDVKSAEAFRMGIRNSGADWSARMGVGLLQQPRGTPRKDRRHRRSTSRTLFLICQTIRTLADLNS